MKVNEFVEMYKKNPRIDINKQLDVQQYVSIALKREMAKLVLENCTMNVDGEVHIDSFERYMLFTIAVIGLHTNLEFSYDDEHSAIDDYDALCESGLLVKIIDSFKQDYDACQEILNMMTADALQDSMTIEKKIYQFLDVIQNVFQGATDKMIDKIDMSSLGDMQVNQEKLIELYDFLKNK